MAMNATVVTMVYAGEDRTVYGIYRARVRFYRYRTAWSWDSNKAERIGSVSLPPGHPAPDYGRHNRVQSGL